MVFKNVWVRPIVESSDAGESLIAGDKFGGAVLPEGWTSADGVLSAVDGAGELGCSLANPTGNVRLSFDARVARGCSSAVHLGGEVSGSPGLGMALSAFSKQPERTGTLLQGSAKAIRGQLAPKDLWFHAELVVREEGTERRVQSFLNGLLVAEELEKTLEFKAGSVRFAGPVGGTLQVRNVKVERLSGR